MKKILLLMVILLFTVLGCNSINVVGTWIKNDDLNTKYIFNEDESCQKIIGIKTITCSYTKNGTTIDIYVDQELYESGQVSPKNIIIGADLYRK